jgi:hypothetical protein
MNLREWIDANAPSRELLWRDSFFQQTNFVGGILAWCLTPEWLRDKFDRLADRVEVVSHHTSKSVRLPVYKIVTDNGHGGHLFTLVFRNNFYNWNVSVEASAPLTEALRRPDVLLLRGHAPVGLRAAVRRPRQVHLLRRPRPRLLRVRPRPAPPLRTGGRQAAVRSNP